MDFIYIVVGVALIAILVLSLVIALLFRRVVKTNEVHIVQ
ncbi:SPFH domain-containing protein [Actinobacillus ureae]|uniref:Uncharacterized protein n=1 Tax=Actinobacillus ureae ATCC 25976 TaxID=887324 RepID=E8KI49_9PAST|nr:hypothetical protein HMPREF0027_1516 [Actinobacillus ureae ATCC 25976]SUT86593.1 SPFH domain-containing protein [Actinobacillus ureae]SUU46384.1 SPFH domain-containing protein [Actinobacillus ureae]